MAAAPQPARQVIARGYVMCQRLASRSQRTPWAVPVIPEGGGRALSDRQVTVSPKSKVSFEAARTAIAALHCLFTLSSARQPCKVLHS